MPETYQALASIYDRIQALDPAVWADRVQRLERAHSQRHGGGDGRDGRPLLLDLGCGTGSFCLEMTERGYDPIGIDQSPAMLSIAQDKMAERMADDAEPPCLFLLQDISRFQLFGTVDLAVSLLDTVNHLTQAAQVRRMFCLCRRYLNPGAVLIIDLADAGYLARMRGDKLFCRQEDAFTLIWQNSYSARRAISRADLTVFLRDDDGRYTRTEEQISQRYYAPEQIRNWASAAGLDVVAEETGRPAGERTFYVLRRPGGQR